MKENSKIKTVTLWIISFIIMIGSSIYQRMTGPTHPLPVELEIEDTVYHFKLIRSHGGEGNAQIVLQIPDTSIKGIMAYKPLNSITNWIRDSLTRSGNSLIAHLPHQPPAGTLQYEINLIKNNRIYPLSTKPVKIRFKGDVPAYILIPHILLMFVAMLFSLRAGFEALVKGNNTYRLALFSTIFLTVGGLVFGPLVQKFAFGQYWTGWPIGQDLTDNKTIAAIILWFIATLQLKKNPSNRLWPILAAIFTFFIFLIPHSVWGSQFDYQTGQINTGK